MPTEEDVRRLLAKAAATIEVDGTVPEALADLPERGHRKWPVLAAAAAVILVTGGGLLVAQQVGDDPRPTPALATDDGSALDDDPLPGLIGYTEDEAAKLLNERGYDVQVDVVPDGCNVAGIVTGSRPAVGTRMQPGDRVTIRVVGRRQVIDCIGELPWSLVWDVVRAARGLADPASLADADFPADIRAAVAGLFETPTATGGSPSMVAVWEFERRFCWPSGGDRLRIWVASPMDGEALCPTTSAVIEYEAGQVRSVRIDSTTVDEEELEEDLRRLAAAEQFSAWAWGDSPAPEFADRVRVMHGGGTAPGHSGWTDEPQDRASYAGCSGVGFPDCGVDPVALLIRHKGPVAATAGRSTCADGGEVPPGFAAAAEDVVRLEQPEPASCARAWAVELWIDEDGVIYGVNQAGR